LGALLLLLLVVMVVLFSVLGFCPMTLSMLRC
jgi:hypothetical protein